MNIIYILLILVLIIYLTQFEQFNEHIVYFDDYIYGYKVYCNKLCDKFQKLLNESKDIHHSTRYSKKIIGVQFRSPSHYNLFIDSLFNKRSFNDVICFEYKYSPKEFSNGSYQINVHNGKVVINKCSFVNKCIFNKKI
jgi:hypothetical protein